MNTEADILWALTRQRHLNFAPGTEVVYGNAAYTVRAVIVRRVSGQSLRAYADEHIFQPLGMASTHFHDDHKEMVAGARPLTAHAPEVIMVAGASAFPISITMVRPACSAR